MTSGHVTSRTVRFADVVQTPDDVDRPRVEPRFGNDDRLIGMQIHRPAAWQRDVRGEVRDEERVAEQFAHQRDAARMLNQFDEHGIEVQQIEHAHVAVVRVEHRYERVDASPTTLLRCRDESSPNIAHCCRIENAFDHAESLVAQLRRAHVSGPCVSRSEESAAYPDDAARP